MNRQTAYSHTQDVRIQASMEHAESHAVVDRITGIRRQLLTKVGFIDFMHRNDSSSFLRGYDFAMKRRYPELIEESTSLHNRLMDIEMVANGYWLECVDFVDGGGI